MKQEQQAGTLLPEDPAAGWVQTPRTRLRYRGADSVHWLVTQNPRHRAPNVERTEPLSSGSAPPSHKHPGQVKAWSKRWQATGNALQPAPKELF